MTGETVALEFIDDDDVDKMRLLLLKTGEERVTVAGFLKLSLSSITKISKLRFSKVI